MGPDTTSMVYEKYVGHPGENYERYFVPAIGEPVARHVVAAAALTPGERVLDLACGTGVAARLAAEHVGSSGAVVGVDPMPPMLEVARRTAPSIEWHQGAAEDLPLPDGSFDAVVCSQGFQFFTDKARALQEIGRILVPGGRVALGMPGPTPPPMAEIGKALENHIGPDAAMFIPAVFAVHDPDEVRAMLAAAGFEDVEVDHEPLPLRLPPPVDFFWQYVHSTPLALLVTRLDDRGRAALQREVLERCQPFIDGDSLVMTPGLLVATARRR